jgi:regulatory protein
MATGDDAGPRPNAESAARAALGDALALLSRRALSVAELRAKLGARNHGSEAIDAAIARLAELRVQDDRALARAVVERRERERGRLGLRFALRQRGIDAATADAALAGVDEASELAAARALLERNAWRFEGARALPRAAGFLARRGFAATVVEQVLRERWGDDADAS